MCDFLNLSRMCSYTSIGQHNPVPKFINEHHRISFETVFIEVFGGYCIDNTHTVVVYIGIEYAPNA